MKRLALISTSLFIGISTGTLSAGTINWGNGVFDQITDSNGLALDSRYTFQLGTFDAGFAPAANNLSIWAEHWNVFDQAVFNPELGYFASSVEYNMDGTSGSLSPAADLGMSFADLGAYVWVYDSLSAEAGNEWFLAAAGIWQFPSVSPDECCDPSLPLRWALSDLDGENVTPIYGGRSGVTGAGTYSVNSSTPLQTYTVVPEPHTLLLASLGLFAATGRRRRKAP